MMVIFWIDKWLQQFWIDNDYKCLQNSLFFASMNENNDDQIIFGVIYLYYL